MRTACGTCLARDLARVGKGMSVTCHLHVSYMCVTYSSPVGARSRAGGRALGVARHVDARSRCQPQGCQGLSHAEAHLLREEEEEEEEDEESV